MIYDALWHGSQPARLPALWDRLPCHASFRLLTDEALHQTLESFTEADLIASGLLRHDAGLAKVHPALSQFPALLLFTRRADGQITQVVANLCGLGPQIGAVDAILQDASLGEIVAQSDVGLMVVSDMTDLAVLWSLQIPAIVPTGLARLNRAPLQAFVRALNSRQLSLVLCDCWLSSLELGHSPYLGSVDRHLKNLERHLGSDLHHRWWTPSTGRLRDVAYALEHGTDEQVCHATYESILYGDPLDGPVPLPISGEPYDLPSALARWRDANLRSDPILRRESWQAVQLQLRRQIADPLLQHALQQADPGERTRWTALAAFVPLVMSELYQMEGKLGLSNLDWRSNLASMSDAQSKQILALLHSLLAQLGGRHVDQR